MSLDEFSNKNQLRRIEEAIKELTQAVYTLAETQAKGQEAITVIHPKTVTELAMAIGGR